MPLFMITPKVARFLVDKSRETPFLVVDLDIVSQHFQELQALFPSALIHYAVRANPEVEVEVEVLQLLAALECNFDVASVSEISQCLATGATSPIRVP